MWAREPKAADGHRCGIKESGRWIEALQLGNVQRIEMALALSLVVAWRINRLMSLGWSPPQLPTQWLFEKDAWQSAYVLNKKKPGAGSTVMTPAGGISWGIFWPARRDSNPRPIA